MLKQCILRRIGPWRSTEIPLRQRSCDLMKPWVTRGNRWVPTVVLGSGKKCYLKITIVSDRVIWLQEHDELDCG
ncbi:hypothetical protein L916_03430 [Phytophthora nicotianae]|uniref:Uncharacterized protein n=1 Tax=Phytophthora nicotianae TaxID=4792 RepID=W2JLZ1_PHYNI|nr:hypothetical protein L916_03430 [Phytophthora nicotianae]